MLLVAATASNMLPRLTQQAPSPSSSPTSAKLLDSEVKTPTLPPPSFLVTAPICSVRGPRCPSTPVLSPQPEFLNPLIGSARPDDLVPALLLLQSWLGSAKGPPALSNHPPVGRRFSASPSLSGVTRCLFDASVLHMVCENMQIRHMESFRPGVEQRSRPGRKGNKSGMEVVTGC